MASKPLAAAMASGEAPRDHLGQHLLGLGGGELAAGLHGRPSAASRSGASVGASVGGQVVLDVGEHPGRVGAGLDGGEDELVEAALDDEGDAARGGSTPAAVGQRGAALGRQHRQRGADPLDPRSASGSTGTRSGSGK